MTTLYLVRHGQASFAAANYDNLSELGHRQAVWLGEHFKARGIVFSHAVCGTLDRQRQTARTLLDAMGSSLPVIEHPGWNEYSGDALYKAYHGEGWARARAKSDVREFYRTIKLALRDWSEDKLEGDLPETWIEFGERGESAMRAACAGLPADAVVLAASSGGTISRVVGGILQAPAQAARPSCTSAPGARCRWTCPSVATTSPVSSWLRPSTSPRGRAPPSWSHSIAVRRISAQP